MENLEIKCRCENLAEVEKICNNLHAVKIGNLHQIDTFFQISSDRLKLREIKGECAELIWYSRPDKADIRTSEYFVYKTGNPEGLKEVLDNVFGIKGVVEKERVLYKFMNVRIHLDRVVALGEFLELEAVLDAENNAEESSERLDYLMEKLNIQKTDLISGAYIDLLNK